MEPDFSDDVSGRSAETLPASRLEMAVLIGAGTFIGVAVAAVLLVCATALWKANADPLPPPRPPVTQGTAPGCNTPTADCRPPTAAPKAQARAPAEPVRVIDGDTVEVAGETIRLADIDTPEMPPRARCDAEARLAELATARLRVLLAERPWRIERQHKRDGTLRLDRYERTLAILAFSADGQSIGLALVGEGLAVAWEGRRHDWCGRTGR